MTSEDLRRQNSILHHRIKQVLEKHPKLRDGTEALALNQDLQVEVGAPFLERTRDNLLERVKAIAKNRPELEQYFEDCASQDGTASRETRLTAALAANVALRVEAERLIAAYIEPSPDRPAIINGLITDGRAQREAQMLAAEALESLANSRPSQRTIEPSESAVLAGVRLFRACHFGAGRI